MPIPLLPPTINKAAFFAKYAPGVRDWQNKQIPGYGRAFTPADIQAISDGLKKMAKDIAGWKVPQ